MNGYQQLNGTSPATLTSQQEDRAIGLAYAREWKKRRTTAAPVPFPYPHRNCAEWMQP